MNGWRTATRSTPDSGGELESCPRDDGPKSSHFERCGTFLHQLLELGRVDDPHPQLFRLAELRATPGPGAHEVVLLGDAGCGLAAGRDDGLLRPLAGVALEGTGGHDGQPGEHSPGLVRTTGTEVPRGGEHHAVRRPALNDLAVPVDLEPGQHGVRDDASDTI